MVMSGFADKADFSNADIFKQHIPAQFMATLCLKVTLLLAMNFYFPSCVWHRNSRHTTSEAASDKSLNFRLKHELKQCFEQHLQHQEAGGNLKPD